MQVQPVLSVLSLWLALSTISLASCCSVASLELHSLLCQVFHFSPLLAWPFAVYQSLILIGICHSQASRSLTAAGD